MDLIAVSVVAIIAMTLAGALIGWKYSDRSTRQNRTGIGVIFDKEFEVEIRQMTTQKIDEIVNKATARLDTDLRSLPVSMDNHVKKSVETYLSRVVNMMMQDLEKAQARLISDIQSGAARIIDRQEAVVAQFESDMEGVATAYAQKVDVNTEKVSQITADLESRSREYIDTYMERFVDNFSQQMATIVDSYVRSAMTDSFDADDYVAAVIKNLEQRKSDIIKDMRR